MYTHRENAKLFAMIKTQKSPVDGDFLVIFSKISDAKLSTIVIWS